METIDSKQRRIIGFIESNFILNLDIEMPNFYEFDYDFDQFMEFQRNTIEKLRESYLDTLLNLMDMKPEIFGNDQIRKMNVFFFNEHGKLVFH